ncbi:MAG: hypothetical protein O2814_04965 [Bacteroidetes bacterium]|nr:hypothetical protein [Bacteroidota bacterium]MDA1224671.1 hypothetical protein [Bacteroidota bacterium]
MFTRLWIALKNWGASEGKPFLGIQALGIPVVTLVFLTIRAQFGNDTRLNSLLSAAPPNWDWIVSCLILIVYSADFISDAIAWDRIGVKFATWQFVLAVGWILFGSFILLMLTFVLPVLDFGTFNMKAFLDLLWSLRYLVLGGLVYCYLKWRGGLMLAYFGPILIAFVFAVAVFGGLPAAGLVMLWLQGFCAFLLNILLMQYFEKDKDAVSETPNLWLLLSSRRLSICAVLLIVLIAASWVLNDFNGNGFDGNRFGTILLLLIYGLMFIFPSPFRFARWYRVLIDGALVLWLI